MAFHVELRRFPHNACRFNMSEAELVAEVLGPWVSDRWVNLGEREWSTRQSRLTILQGPELPASELTMGRGWRAAQRQGRDVTAEMVGAARNALSAWSATAGAIAGPHAQPGPWLTPGVQATLAPAGAQTQPSMPSAQARGELPNAAPDRPTQPPVGSSEDQRMLGDSLGLELLAELADGPRPLSLAWQLAARRLERATPAESLALAESAVRSLLEARLLVLCVPEEHPQAPAARPSVEEESADARLAAAREPLSLLRARESWSDAADAPRPSIRRA